MYNAFRIFFAIYIVAAAVVSFFAFHFMNEASSKKAKAIVVTMALIALVMLFVMMEIRP